MVRHEAVRKNCKPSISGRAQKLRTDSLDAFVDHEQSPPLDRAERQEIPMETEVVEGLQMFRVTREHAVREGKPYTEVRLKPDATSAGPAEAGHHARRVRSKPDA